MSKYYKVEDVQELITACMWRMTLAKERHGEGFVDYSKQVLDVDELIKRISNLPTIEPIEENGIFKGINPTIEVGEDCISREDAVNAIMAHFIPQTYTGDDVDRASKLARKIMANVPSVTTEQSSIVGEWKITNTYKDHSGRVVDRVEHTDCGYIWNREMGEPLHNFCPYCGKKMKGEKE